MTIIEQTVIPKSPARRSEDGIVATADFIAVIDGSTSKSTVCCHRRYRGDGPLGLFRDYSNGEQAMLIVAACIRRMKRDASCHQFCREATAAVRSYYKRDKLEHLARHPEDRLTASCIVFSRLRREIWMVGDCQALLWRKGENMGGAGGRGGEGGRGGAGGRGGESSFILLDNPKPSEQELAAMRAAIITSSPEPWDHFLSDDTARKAIIPRMLETMRQQNNGYSVIDGFPVDETHVKTFTLDLKPWEIVLASDGYPFLCPTLDESERRLAWQREHDPLNIGEFKATKAFVRGNNSFDDRSYIRFVV